MPGDLVKAVLATLITVAVAKAYPAAFAGRRFSAARNEPTTTISTD